MSTKEIHRYLDTLPSDIRKNLEVITPKDLGQDFFLHLSRTRMDKTAYRPRIGTRQAISEDRMVPRITVAPTLYGCYLGHGSLHFNTTDYKNPNMYDSDNIKPGLYINRLSFEYALKPTKKLVYDADVTDEHWLVAYSKDTAEYTSENIGKLFVSQMVQIPVAGQRTQNYLTLFVELTDDKPIPLKSDTTLPIGYHKLTDVPGPENKDILKAKIQISPISRSEFNAEKKDRIALLSDSGLVLKPW
ncbi:MAG: hypothetical protein PHN51_10120 [Candidatus Nanopelagicales bacterium]|nr:hypothetical protein [Candidatus Nanopelagicales bacterium]